MRLTTLFSKHRPTRYDSCMHQEVFKGEHSSTDNVTVDDKQHQLQEVSVGQKPNGIVIQVDRLPHEVESNEMIDLANIDKSDRQRLARKQLAYLSNMYRAERTRINHVTANDESIHNSSTSESTPTLDVNARTKESDSEDKECRGFLSRLKFSMEERIGFFISLTGCGVFGALCSTPNSGSSTQVKCNQNEAMAMEKQVTESRMISNQVLARKIAEARMEKISSSRADTEAADCQLKTTKSDWALLVDHLKRLDGGKKTLRHNDDDSTISTHVSFLKAFFQQQQIRLEPANDLDLDPHVDQSLKN